MSHEAVLLERLFAKRQIDAAGCWIWTGARIRWGYGHLWDTREKATRRVHRIAYELLVGEIPTGAWVLHRCDVRACFNPEHLFLGDRAANMADCVAKGRTSRGALNGHAKITEEQALAILTDTRSQKEIALEYGVDPSAISHLKSGRNWGHLRAPG